MGFNRIIANLRIIFKFDKFRFAKVRRDEDHHYFSCSRFRDWKHPTMSSEEMYEMNAQVLHEGYSMGRALVRTFHTVKKRSSLGVAMNSFFTQTSLKKSFREQFKGLPK